MPQQVDAVVGDGSACARGGADDGAAVGALAALVARAGGEDPLEALAALAQARREVERLEELQVRRARVRQASWALIAEVMGVSRQAAHQRFRLSRWSDR